MVPGRGSSGEAGHLSREAGDRDERLWTDRAGLGVSGAASLLQAGPGTSWKRLLQRSRPQPNSPARCLGRPPGVWTKGLTLSTRAPERHRDSLGQSASSSTSERWLICGSGK